MRARLTICAIAAICFFPALSVLAELQSVEVGGYTRLRARYFDNVYDNQMAMPGALRIAGPFLEGRPIGPWGARSRFDWDARGNDWRHIEQAVKLNVRADFTGDVGAFIEFQGYQRWGDNFRSDYVTGLDARPGSGRNVEVFQAYIDADNLVGQPLRLRIGRQALTLGNAWLVGTSYGIVDKTWDAARLTYDNGAFEADAWWAKLFEGFAAEADGDIDFYGVYGTWKQPEPLNVSLYWMLVRDARAIRDTNLIWYEEWFEELLGFDDYGRTHLNTVGTRLFGESHGFDYDWELAYQFGQADAVGALFRNPVYGDNRARFDGNWATDAELGYCIDSLAWCPRIFIGGAYFSGEDNRDITVWDWLNPFPRRGKASMSFNRMFSSKSYTFVLDLSKNMTNFNQLRAGVQVQPTERLRVGVEFAHYNINEPFDWPPHVTFRRTKLPLFPNLPFITEKASKHMGDGMELLATYQYSPDLSFGVGWHLVFPGKGLRQGSFNQRNGLQFMGGTDKDPASQYFLDTSVRF